MRFGHRLSIDLDLFTNELFDYVKLSEAIAYHFPKTEVTGHNERMLFMYVNDVKVDLVSIPYPYIEPIEVIDGVRMASIPDIIAMKLSAISSRGVKKDFWDVAELLNDYSISEMIDFYKLKYSSHDIWHLLRSMVYFEDAEKQRNNPSPLKSMTWAQVKKKVEKAVRVFINKSVR